MTNDGKANASATFLQNSGPSTALKVVGSHSSNATICTGVAVSSCASAAGANQSVSGAMSNVARRRMVRNFIVAFLPKKGPGWYAGFACCQERGNQQARSRARALFPMAGDLAHGDQLPGMGAPAPPTDLVFIHFGASGTRLVDPQRRTRPRCDLEHLGHGIGAGGPEIAHGDVCGPLSRVVDEEELVEAGKLSPVIDRQYPLSEVPDAIRYVGTGQAQGKIVISMP